MSDNPYLSAKDARNISGPTLEESIHDELINVCELIKVAAKDKQRKIDLHTEPWVYGAYKNSDLFVGCRDKLEELGYKVEFFYEEKQFVNMYTTISW